MDRKSFVPLQLGPGQNFGLTNPDTNEGLPVPLEGDAINQHDGPDRTNADIEEFAKNYVGDNSDSIEEMVAAVKRQKENAEKPVDGIVVIPAPSRLASGGGMSNYIYAKIISSMKRLAADVDEPKVAPSPASPPAEGYLDAQKSVDLEERLNKELEVQRAQQEAFKEEQRKERQREIDKQYGNPEEQTRQTGPARDLSRHKTKTINPGEPGYDELVAAAEEILDIKEQIVEVIDRHITESESIFRRARALKEAFVLPRELASEAYKKYSKEGDEAIKVLDSILKASPELKSVPVTGEAGTTSRVKMVRGNLNSLTLEGLINAVMNPVALKGVLDNLRTQQDVKSEGKSRADELEKLAVENPKQLRYALQLLLEMMKKNAQSVIDTNAKISKLSIVFAPRAAKLNERIKQVRARAEEYNQSMSDIAAKYRVSDAELQDAKVKLRQSIAKLDKIMGVATQLSSVGESEKTASLIRIAADSWEKISSDIDEISFEAETALEGLGLLDKAGQVVNALSSAGESLAAVDEVISELEPLSAAMVSDSAQAPAPTDEVMDVAPEVAPAPEEGGSWYEKMMGTMTPGQTPAAWAAAAARAEIIRNAVKKKRDEKVREPKELEEIGTEMPTDTELKKQPLSYEELNKAKLAREKAIFREKMLQEREDEAAAKPSAEAKRIKRDEIAAAKQVASEIIPKEALDAFVSSHRLARESSTQLADGLKAGKEILAAVESAVAPEYSKSRSREEGEDEATHHARLKAADAEYINLADKLLSANEKFAAAFRSVQPEGEKRIYDSIITLGNMYKIILDVEQDEAILSNPSLVDQMENSMRHIFTELRKYAKKQKDPEAATKAVKMLSRFANLSSDFTIRFSSRSSKRSESEVAYVQKTMGPAIEESLKQVFEVAPEVAEPLATEGPNPELPLGSSEPKAAAVLGMARTAQELEAEDEKLLADMRELLALMPEATAAAKEVDEYLMNAFAFADSIKEPVEKIVDAISRAKAAPKDEAEGDWSSVVEDATSWAKEWAGKAKDFIAPPAPQMAPMYAGAGKSGNNMYKTAGEFDKFDVSHNRLEIVVGKNGKRTLVINKGLKNLVSKRVHDMMYGRYKCGDTVQVDMIDYLGMGVVKAYLGAGIYRVEVDGAVMEVPEKNVLGLDVNPWR